MQLLLIDKMLNLTKPSPLTECYKKLFFFIPDSHHLHHPSLPPSLSLCHALSPPQPRGWTELHYPGHSTFYLTPTIKAKGSWNICNDVALSDCKSASMNLAAKLLVKIIMHNSLMNPTFSCPQRHP